VFQNIERDSDIEGAVLKGQRLAWLQQDDGGIVELTDIGANYLEPRGNEGFGQRYRTASDIEQAS
jgi:hypothetical protein